MIYRSVFYFCLRFNLFVLSVGHWRALKYVGDVLYASSVRSVVPSSSSFLLHPRLRAVTYQEETRGGRTAAYKETNNKQHAQRP